MNQKVFSLFEPAIGLLSVLAVALFGIDTFITLPEEVKKLIDFYDFILCGVFFIDFCLTFKRAKDRTKYFFTFGWLDFVSCIPVVDFFRMGRFAKIIKVVRLLRMAKSAHIITKNFMQNKRDNTVLMTALMGIIVICLSSILILMTEDVPEGKIHTAEDAIWWSFVTATTVGYGDYDPVTIGGRIIASLLMITGIGIFGVLTATLTSFFSHSESHSEDDDLKNEIREIKFQLQKMSENEDRSTKKDAA